MKLMLVVPPSGICDPVTADSVDIFWFTSPTGGPDCVVEYITQATWTNPCAGSFAISYVYRLYYDIAGVWILEFTSGTLTGTIGPGTTLLTDDFVPNIGPQNVSRHAYFDLTVTWPGGAVVTYTAADDFTAACS